MAGYMKDLGQGKYQFEVSDGTDGKGKRKKFYKTIHAKGRTPDAQRKNAERELAIFMTEVFKGEHLGPSNYSFGQYIAEWQKDAKRRLAPKTYHRYCELLKSRIIPHIGNVKLDKLNPIIIENFYNDIRKPYKVERTLKDGTKKVTEHILSETTVRHHHRLIRTILQTAFRKGLIKENPCDRVDAPRATRQELTCYNDEQISTLIAALEGEELKYKTCIHIALAGGLRLGELMGLEWPDVDFKNRTISIKRTSQYLPGRDLITKDPKNETSKRTVSLPTAVMELISQLEQSQKVQQDNLGNLWKGKNFKGETNKTEHKENLPGRLFTKTDGSPMHPHTPSKWFHDFLNQNNLPPLPFHGLRHTSASYLIGAGQDVVTVAKRLGHSNSNTTLAIYAHSFRQRDEEAAARMAEMYTAYTQQGQDQQTDPGA